MEFLDRPPLPAFWTASIPFDPAPPAFGTEILRRRFCHAPTLSDFPDIVEGLEPGMRVIRRAERHPHVRESKPWLVHKPHPHMASW